MKTLIFERDGKDVCKQSQPSNNILKFVFIYLFDMTALTDRIVERDIRDDVQQRS